jgi:hypothetical protein
VSGGPANDFIEDFDLFPDEVSGGSGDDRIVVRQSVFGGVGRETVTCGAGFDLVFADQRDSVASDCESVEYPSSTAANSGELSIAANSGDFCIEEVPVQSKFPRSDGLAATAPCGARPMGFIRQLSEVR